jgi:KDO2-lipid IV(A) lauroyltransferase
MSRIAYYLFLKPLSMLPLPILYLLSNFMHALFKVTGYRKSVVYGNLRRVFPEKSEKEIKKIADAFFANFCDLLVETIRLFSMPKAEILRRFKMKNADLFEHYAAKNQGVIVVAGHYANWEMAVLSCSMQIPYHGVAVYSPLKDPFFEKVILASRSRFGMQLLPKQELKTFYEEHHQELNVFYIAVDQSPSNPDYAHWTTFLGQDTSVFLGTEKYSKRYNYPVIFGKINRLRRGYYDMEFILVVDDPSNTLPGEITERHTQILEKMILENPSNWLWTHRRWKHQRNKPTEQAATEMTTDVQSLT